MTQNLGRPRDITMNTRILQTTLKLLQEHGYSGLRIDEIAHQSGIAKTTIYRRWPTLAHLAVAALDEALGSREVSIRGDLVTDIDHVINTFADLFSGDNATLVAIGLDIHRHNDAQLKRIYRESIVNPIRNQIISTIQSASISDAQAEDLTDALIGGLLYRSAILGEAMDHKQIKRFILSILATNIEVLQANATS
ncbi:TetR/AcrR family transcriptional regulator [Corynebacterium freiburgense]|uniref:TetR/AcrR family transcriptional regulator n=1 Tax=Corynebacterium freiburgense TaxID=556548 RepID=UPI0009FD9E8F|nr:TetR/AcrR family transcriptional regulator [Corynebacterium freiburgense]